MILPTGRLALLLVALAAVGFGAALAGVPVAVAFATLGVLALVLALFDAFSGTSHSLLTVTRRHPPVAVMGAPARIDWELTSEAKRPLRVVVADELAPSLQAETRRFAVLVPVGSTVEVSAGILPTRRGRFDIGHLTVRIMGRWGLMGRQRDVPLATVLRVHPRFRSKEEAELRIKRAQVLEVGIRSASGLGGGTEFEQLKEYLPDDDYRRIDWTATARAGKPVVRTYRAEKNQSVLVLLDNGRVQAGLIEGIPRVEYSMDAAMMLTTLATRLGDHCGLIGFDSQIRTVLPPSRRRDQVSQVAEAMYDLHPELAESDYSGAFAFAAARFRRRMLIVLLTDLVDHSISGALLPALPTLTRKHMVLVAAIRDPQLERWADPTPLQRPVDDTVPTGGNLEPEELISRRIAALDTLRTRELAIARLRSAGATVVDTRPERLASELGDAYLMIKGTGRL